jgi:hypothetical protein
MTEKNNEWCSAYSPLSSFWLVVQIYEIYVVFRALMSRISLHTRVQLPALLRIYRSSLKQAGPQRVLPYHSLGPAPVTKPSLSFHSPTSKCCCALVYAIKIQLDRGNPCRINLSVAKRCTRTSGCSTRDRSPGPLSNELLTIVLY